MFSGAKQVYKVQTSRQLPSFSDSFKLYTLSMNSSIEQFLRSSNLQQNSEIPKLRHKKNSLKRHLEQEQEKVVVQPIQNDMHIAKRFRSDWDLLFFNEPEAGNKKDQSGARAKRQSFLVRGKEMKSFFHLLGLFHKLRLKLHPCKIKFA